MGTHLQQLLWSLCSNTEWNYTVFWKLRHRARMVLTCEDAYCSNHGKHGHFECKCSETLGSLHDGHHPYDAISLAVAKMSCHVYTLGEGIIGQVAVTGKHQWIFADEHAVNSLSSSWNCDGWQAQLLAGIQTIVVAPVVPHGVVLLGSLSKVNEDLKLLSHLRHLFSSLQDSAATHASNLMQQSLQSLLRMPVVPSSADTLQGCLCDPTKDVTKENPHMSLQKQGSSFISEDVEHAKLVRPMYQKGESKVVNANTVQKITSTSQNNNAESQNSYEALLASSKFGVECNYSLSAQSLDKKLQSNVGKNLEFHADYDSVDALTSSFKLSTGYELHEAVGLAFLKQNYSSWCVAEESEPASVSDIADGMEQSMLTSDTCTDHLLEAAESKFCHKDRTFKLKSFSSSTNSMLTTDRMPEPSSNTSHTVNSACYSIDGSLILEESIQHCLTSSESYSTRTSNGFSSSPVLCKGKSLRPIEPAKGNKKRAGSGENCRPRPRDRQLIQDRIKELRELVPNGSKCSIDSLLERTIKYTLFLQSISKHADKLSNCARSRVNKDGCPSYERGRSWAVEVGGDVKICPIVVENLNRNGQLLIEMLCEDCDHFLEIAEAIRGLGLTILKCITEGHGDKTWTRFVLEGQNNRNMHRMDVLWSLVQILQMETAT